MIESNGRHQIRIGSCTKNKKCAKINGTWGSTWFRQQLLSKVASSRHTLNVTLKLNDESYSFASPALAVA